MTQLGSNALLIALVLSAYAATAAVVGARRGYPELFESARNAVFVVGGMTTVAAVALLYALITRDFSLEYVASYTSRDLPLFYTVSAFWAGQAGSLLLWAWTLALLSVAVLIQHQDEQQELLPYVTAVLMTTEAFFLILMLFASNPFARLGFTPPNGQGLNPLLQNLGMIFHPVTIYLGYVGFTVPFAFAVAALITGRLDDAWIRATRRWTLISWLFLSIGIGLGAQWAYLELGWGGYWGWDPVENASLMPWLTGTAYLHSVMIQERRGMLKVWNLLLILFTFGLTLLGTFITRSGIIESVHAFGVSSLGPYFLAFIALTVFGFLFLLFRRLAELRGENELDSLVSRESSFLLNNLILMGAAFATLWGTLFPMISEAVTGQEIAVSAPFFNQVNGPIFMVLIALIGVCPLIGWRRASPENLWRSFLWPMGAGLVVAGALLALEVRQGYALLAFGICAFVVMAIVLEFWRGMRARQRMTGENPLTALVRLTGKNQRRYGGYIVHLGVVFMAVGIVGSTFFKQETQASLAPGETLALGSYTLEYVKLAEVPAQNHTKVLATVNVYRDGRLLGVITPEKDYHHNQSEPTTEVAIRTTLAEDLYVILAGWEDGGAVASFKVIINPLVVWLWIGGAVLTAGTTFALWPSAQEVRRQVSRLATARVGSAPTG
ncbi:MAG: heme lyase CcmF/NrfE family subunit [Anaerolineae bacterium]